MTEGKKNYSLNYFGTSKRKHPLRRGGVRQK